MQFQKEEEQAQIEEKLKQNDLKVKKHFNKKERQNQIRKMVRERKRRLVEHKIGANKVKV